MKREPFRGPATLALAAALCTLAFAVPAGADGGHGHGDHDGDRVVVRPGESIQAAVDAARPGSTIVVKRGTYAENVVIVTDGITLKGRGAELVPPATPTPSACSFGEPARDGICAVGQLDTPPDGPPTVRDPIEDVTIKGFDVEGFAGTGILFLGAEDLVAKHNETEDNGEYGIASFFTDGGAILGNETSGSEEAGIYVGDSPDANVLIAGNRTFDNHLFGIFLRDAADGRVIGNESTGNCVGAIVLNTGPNVASDWRFFANRIHDNDRFCPADGEEGTPPLSGIGIALANASGNVIVANKILGNEPGGEVPFAGGVVIVDARSPGAAPPSDNLVKGNVILGNDPDVFWDGSGEDNVIERNLCRTSVPEDLCDGFRHRHDDDRKGDDDHRRGDHDHDDDDRGGWRHRHDD